MIEEVEDILGKLNQENPHKNLQVDQIRSVTSVREYVISKQTVPLSRRKNHSVTDAKVLDTQKLIVCLNKMVRLSPTSE